MNQKKSKKMLTGLLLTVTAVMLTSLGCQKVETTPEKTIPQQTLATTYQTEIQEQLEQVITGEPEITPVYEIADPNGPAPVPNPECYGVADDPKELQWLIEEARKVLEEQELHFSTDIEIFPDSQIHYYLDDTILAITWKEMHDYSVYTFSEVKIAHPSQFRRFLAGGEYGSEKQFITTEMAASVNAVVASSGDFYAHRRYGAVKHPVWSDEAVMQEGELDARSRGALMMSLRLFGQFGENSDRVAALAAAMLNETLHAMFPSVADALVVCPVLRSGFADEVRGREVRDRGKHLPEAVRC